MSGSEAFATDESHGATQPAPTGRTSRAADPIVERLAAAHHACQALRDSESLEAGLRNLAASFRDIFDAGLVVVDWFDPSEPARGSSPAEAELASWWAPWQSRIDQAPDAPATVFTVPAAERVGALADVERLVVLELAADGRHGAVGIGYPEDRRCSEEELTAFGILGEHLALTLARRRSPCHALPDRASATRPRGTDELVAIAAHELRTPLTPITMLLQSLERKASTGAVDLEAIARTRRQVQRLTKMITDLLDLSRLRRDRLSLDPKPVALAGALTEALRLFGEAAPKNTFDVSLPEEPLHVVFDRERLQQSLTAWLEHVARVSPVGAPIQVKVERVGRFVSLSITGERGPLDAARSGPREPVKAASLSLAVHLSDELTAHHGGGLAIDGTCGERVTARLPLHESTDE